MSTVLFIRLIKTSRYEDDEIKGAPLCSTKIEMIYIQKIFDFLLTRFQTGWLLWRHENITTVLIRSNQKWLVWMLSRQSDRTQAKIDLWHYLNEVSKTPNWDNYLTTDFGCIMQFHANLEPVPSYNYPQETLTMEF